MPIRHKISPPALEVIRTIQNAGHDAYVVGGAVRDLLLGREPKDYDVATDATPEQLKSIFGRRARIIGRRFRLAHIRGGEQIFEVSTFRRAPTLEERRGREDDEGLMVWRDNEYGTLDDDAFRRDFTVNAIFFDPLAPDNGIVDHVGGMSDLEAGLVRAIGDPAVRLEEDPVRLLRACKLVGQYGFRLEPELDKQVRELAPKLALSSTARVLEEIYKILRKPWSLPIFAACRQTGVLDALLPALADGWDTEAGRFARGQLEARDELLRDGAIYPSRVTGLVSMILPFVAEELGDGPVTEMWQNFGGVDKQLQRRLRGFFQPYTVPRYTIAKARDVLLLLPKMLPCRGRGKIMRHPEYDRARDSYLTFARAAGLPPERANYWPAPEKRGTEQKKKSRRGRRRRQRR